MAALREGAVSYERGTPAGGRVLEADGGGVLGQVEQDLLGR